MNNTSALFGNNVNAARARLNAGIHVNTRNGAGYTPLLRAVMMGRVGMVRLLIERGAHVNARDRFDRTALMMAVESNHAEELVRELIRGGAQLNARDNLGTTVLMRASHNGQLNIVQMLVKKGAHVNLRTPFGDSALSMTTQPAIARFLIKHGGARVNANIRARVHGLVGTAVRNANQNRRERIMAAHGSLSRVRTPHTNQNLPQSIIKTIMRKAGLGKRS